VSGTWGTDSRHHYSKDQPWSADGVFYCLENRGGGSPSPLLLDGHTFAPLLSVPSSAGLWDYRWHPAKARARLMINVNSSGTELSWVDATTGLKARTWTLPFAVSGFGSGEGNASRDGRFVALASASRLVVVDMDPQQPYAPYPNRRIGPARAVGLARDMEVPPFDVTARLYHSPPGPSAFSALRRPGARRYPAPFAPPAGLSRGRPDFTSFSRRIPMQVSQILTRQVETIRPDTTVREAAQRMRSMDVGSLPVCDGRHLLGMVTDRDITIRVTAEGRDAANTPVHHAMTPDVAFVFEDQDVQEAAKLMRERQIRRLPVLSRDKQLVGILALGDIATTGNDRLSGDALEQISEPTHGRSQPHA